MSFDRTIWGFPVSFCLYQLSKSNRISRFRIGNWKALKEYHCFCDLDENKHRNLVIENKGKELDQESTTVLLNRAMAVFYLVFVDAQRYSRLNKKYHRLYTECNDDDT